MKTLIIYDNDGYIISYIKSTPEPRMPVGIPYIYEEIPEGKQLKITNGIGVDVSVTPNTLILEDIPLTETEELRQELSVMQEALDYILMNGGV